MRLVAVGAASTIARRAVHPGRDGTSDGRHTRPRPRRRGACRTAARELAARALPGGRAIAAPVVIRRRAARAAALAAICGHRARRRGRRAACSRCSTPLLDLPGRCPARVTSGTWLASTRFPVACVPRRRRRRPRRSASRGCRARGAGPTDIAVFAASRSRWRSPAPPGCPSCCSPSSSGAAVGALLLVAFGAPNRRPTPAAVAAALREAGSTSRASRFERAVGGRSQLYRADDDRRRTAFVKVYGQDSRDADLLYRGYRTLVLRGPERRLALARRSSTTSSTRRCCCCSHAGRRRTAPR